MTFIQPHKKFDFMSGVIALLVILTLGATFALVAVYNGIVNANHNLASLKAKLDAQGAENTDLQNRIVAELGSDAIAKTAASGALVEDKHPQYLSVSGNQSITLR